MTQYSLFCRLIRWLIFVLVSFTVQAQSDDRCAEELFREGYVLYQQHSAARSLAKFKEAAQLGHVEAAYYAGNIIRQNYTYITKESEQYYRQAADGGDVDAMLRLGQKDSVCGILRECEYDRKAWIEKALQTALPRAEAGDSEAMLQLYSIYWVMRKRVEALAWTIKAARHGNAFAQYWLAVGLLDERKMGFYWTKAGRRADILKWLEASAEQGFPKAMHRLASEYAQDNRMEEAVEWLERMGETDYFSAIYEYGLVLIDGPDGAEGLIQYPETKPVEGLAMLFALHRETRRSSVQSSIDRRLPDLSPEIVAEAKEKSEELLVDTPILHYLPKFGI